MSRFTRVARCRVSGQHDVGHEGVITGRDVLSLRSSFANPQGVAQLPLQSTISHSISIQFIAIKQNFSYVESEVSAKEFVCATATMGVQPHHCYKSFLFDYGE
ncbi:hypothetical protein [Lysinibacillus sp. NPDC056232]|uniref:hypothetical protein n=1 Tax=Lysinibacillus sp. NPDC056232 TaxID=3345756 RepID=UPI0035E0DD33